MARRDNPIPRTKKNYRSTKSGAGMTRAGVAAYRRANPGSKLKTAVTGKVKPGSKAANRRKSYCARSLGQLKRSSAKTRNDPNSRIRQARRRWKCQIRLFIISLQVQINFSKQQTVFLKGKKMRRAILDALRARYEAEIAEADATANIFLDNSVGIGEHPQHIEEVNKQIEKIANAKEKLDVLDEFEPERGETL